VTKAPEPASAGGRLILLTICLLSVWFYPCNQCNQDHPAQLCSLIMVCNVCYSVGIYILKFTFKTINAFFSVLKDWQVFSVVRFYQW
jgi:hypothetical protein